MKDTKAQVSAELILLLAGIMIIVLLMLNIYQDYVTDFTTEINHSEVSNITKQIDELKNNF
ncbi:MAG: hypothetical protein BZ136_06720 [Methanosphaera sp. rholeuAM74]|nr:MAG: hypothetical protein BZ136_06720 [Methanosphaera sp. rholeuAM74]